MTRGHEGRPEQRGQKWSDVQSVLVLLLTRSLKTVSDRVVVKVLMTQSHKCRFKAQEGGIVKVLNQIFISVSDPLAELSGKTFFFYPSS